MTWIVGSKILISNLHRKNFHEGGTILITATYKLYFKRYKYLCSFQVVYSLLCNYEKVVISKIHFIP